METKVCKGPCGQEKPISEFYNSRQGKAVYKFAKCKDCCSQRTKELRSNPTPENRARWGKYSHNTNTRRKYGLEPEQYELMLREQGGVCSICGQNNDGKRLAVDHDHKTKRVRGLLCGNCNNGLGRFQDAAALLRAAADYLEREYTVPPQPRLPQTPLPTVKNSPKKNTCTVDGCGRPTFYRLYCQKHYFRLWRTGSLELKRRVTSAL